MSLDWNLSNIENHETVCWTGEGKDRRLSEATYALIWMCMFVKMRSITEGNWVEFYTRCRLWEKTRGALRQKAGDRRLVDVPLKAAEVQAHIGLSTNVITEKVGAFLKDLWRREEAEVRGGLAAILKKEMEADCSASSTQEPNSNT